MTDAGHASRKEAEQKAAGEYELFAARRRAEREAEADIMKQLEDAAGKRPKPKRKPQS